LWYEKNKRMKSKFILILTFCSLINAFGQFEKVKWNWDELAINKQFRLWENDSIKIQNKLINGKLVRLQSFESGIPQLIAEIEQERKIDSIIIFNPETLDIDSIHLDTIFGDFLNGIYHEYHENGVLKSTGRMKNNEKIGQWIDYWNNSNVKMTANFFEKERRKGDFKEFYQNGQLKTSGEYGEKKIIEKHICFNPETFTEYDCSMEKLIEIKIGKWKHFDESGKRIKK